jgi:hypothetical protein
MAEYRKSEAREWAKAKMRGVDCSGLEGAGGGVGRCQSGCQ